MPNEAGFSETHGWNEGASPFRPPAVTELIGKEIGNRMLLVKNEYWIGSDPSCPICRPDDPFCEPRHVGCTAAALAAAGTPNTPRPKRALAADAPDHRRIDGPVPDRRATISAQGEVTQKKKKTITKPRDDEIARKKENG